MDLVKLGASAQDDETGAIQWQATRDDEGGETEPYGELAAFGWIGLSCVPLPPSDAGYAEGVVARDVGSRDIVIAARDTRTASMAGRLQPGDTALHTTGPRQSARIILSESGRDITILASDNGTDGALLQLSAPDKTVQVTVGGANLEVSDRGISMTSPNGQHGITVTNDGIHIRSSSIKLGGMVPFPGYLMVCASPVNPGSVATLPMTGAAGITVCI